MDINCDMGEGTGNDEALLPFINTASIACGFHAGDETTMEQSILLGLKYGINIGAHPSFPDREHFGRTAMHFTPAEIYQIVTQQLQLIANIAQQQGAKLFHVKPHGALYNMAAKDAILAGVIAKAVYDVDASLVFYGLSESVMIDEAAKLGLPTANEVFADRTYQSDGSLTARSLTNALLTNTADVVKQVKGFVAENKVMAVTGEKILLKADTVCIHGDGPHALAFAKAIHQCIHEK